MAKSFFLVDEVFETYENFYKKKIKADIITLLHVFEHLMDPVDFLCKIKKNILKKNGLLYLEIPNPYSNPLNDPTHLFLYSEDSIKYILESCNYKIISLERKGLYQQGILLRNNKNLNLHVLAQSIDKKGIFFSKVNIGKKIYRNLKKERTKVSLKLTLNSFKTLVIIFSNVSYRFLFMLINYLNPNFAVYIHERIKKIFKK